MLTNPIWVVKTRMFSSSPKDPAAYRGLLRTSCSRSASSPCHQVSDVRLSLPACFPDGLSSVYSQEGFRGLYKGSLLALVGVTNGSIQFAAYEEIKRRRSDLKRARIEGSGGTWTKDDDMLVGCETIGVYLVSGALS